MKLLAKVERGRTSRPPRILLYGVEGIGKSTFGSRAPKPIFLQIEDSLDEINGDMFRLAKCYDDVALTRGGRAFRRSVQAALAERGVRPIAGRPAVPLDVHPPTHRRRDLDNALKALLDALQHGGAYHDDAPIDDLPIRRCFSVFPICNGSFVPSIEGEGVLCPCFYKIWQPQLLRGIQNIWTFRQCWVGKGRGRGSPMLKVIVNTGVPVLVVFGMVVVGMGLTVADFRQVVRRPAIVLAAILGQCVLLPAIGWFLVRCLELRPAIAQGVLLVAACPSGAMANVYTHLARANVALSVTLTAVSCLVAGLTTPLAMAILQAQTGQATDFTVPPGVVAVQLLVLLVLPILGGMSIRGRWPGFSERYGRLLLRLSIAALLTLLGFVVAQEAAQFARSLSEIATAVALLTVLAFGAGWATGWIGGAGAADRFTVGIVFVVRNVGIATAVAVTVLGRMEFAVFATAYFLAQVPILLAAAIVFRSTRAGDGNTLTEVAHP